MQRIHQIEQMLKESGFDCFLTHALALEYIKIGNDEKAQSLFKEVLAKDEQYVGTYYHLAKLYERMSDEPMAIATYEKGMAIAKTLNEKHAFGELRSAYEELTM
jgi:tetratricopeptide (TPR) repeat protein